MRRSWLLVLGLVLLSAPPAAAQDTQNGSTPGVSAQAGADGQSAPLAKGSSEWLLSAGLARGVVVFYSAGGHRFGLQVVSWARVLTDSHLPGFLRGRFAWALEAVPVFAQYEPTRTYGFGLSPLVWRWNFEPHGRVAPYAELAGGGIWTTKPVPDETTTANFTAHVGGGIRYFFKPRQAFVVNYWFHHISNGNRLDRNPGVNSHIVQVGLSYARPK
jgi:hypothetical protein